MRVILICGRGISVSRPRRDPGGRHNAAITAQVIGARVRASMDLAASFLYFKTRALGEELFI